MSVKQENERHGAYVAYGIAFGAGLGLVAGIVTPLGVALGMVFGAGLGVAAGVVVAGIRK